MTESTSERRDQRLALTSTYRVQVNKSFTLGDARAIVGYLDQLGISHLYCSPILKARPGSMHGYDVVDPTQVNPEIGTLDDLRALARALHDRGMGMILDIVPNHMGIGPDNPYWEDVLTHGVQSRYARWFDVEWEAAAHKIVLPVLRDELDAVIARDELAFDVTGKSPRLKYFDSSWPLDPATLPGELQLVHFDPTAVADPSVFVHGDEGRRERLRKVLDAQHYRLISWKRGPDEINYRRFFDVNDLAALRQEDPNVFRESHALILSLVAEGVIDGLRVDHVDGLADPLGYLTQLREAIDAPSFPIVVEKILSPGEALREGWPVEGTTGYEFLNDLEDVFLDPAGAASIESAYRRTRRLTRGRFADVAHEGKLRILSGPLRADVLRLVRQLAALIAAGGGPPLPDADMEAGITQFIAALPVYRTYVDGRTAPHPDDVAVIDRAVKIASERMQGAPILRVVELVADVALGRANERHPLPPWPQRLTFIQRLQQTTGPATAKGIEDTALYVYVPLVSRNEVGGAPDRCLDDAVGRLHRANLVRARLWPGALTCTNTHDTKRSADVRSRLDVLSEVAKEWQRTVARWRRLNHRHRSLVRGRLAPDTNTEYLLYQTLVGIWPTPAAGRVDDVPDSAWRDSARKRLEKYMLKAVREAKTRTTWTEPDEQYEAALKSFIQLVLEPSVDAPFLPDVARFVARVAPFGQWNALARLLVHLTAPGTPDTYRGDELWFFTLVDPDNRQPVDYAARQQLLDEVDRGEGNGWGGVRWDGPLPLSDRQKIDLLRRALHTRRAQPLLFSRGSYQPLEVRGARAAHITAFLRAHSDHRAIVVAPRLLASITDTQTGTPDWADTELLLPSDLSGRRLRQVLLGTDLSVPDDGPVLRLSEILKELPLSLLSSSGR